MSGDRLRIEALELFVPEHASAATVAASTPSLRPLLSKPLSLTLSPGEILCVLGMSGVGKTRLLRAICGLDDARSGQVTLLLDPKNESSAVSPGSLGASAWRRHTQ